MLVCLFCIFSSNAFASDSSDVPTEVIYAAEQGLKSFIADATEIPTDYGYTISDELSQVQLGAGHKLYAVDKNLLYKESASLKDYSFDTGAWLFTIDLNGTAKNYLTIALEDGEYKAVQMGGNATNYGNTLEKFESDYGSPEVIQAGVGYYFVSRNSSNDVILSSVPKEKSLLFRTLDNEEYRTTSDVVTFLRNQVNPESQQLRGGGTVINNSENHNTNLTFLASGVTIIAGVGILLYLRKKLL